MLKVTTSGQRSQAHLRANAITSPVAVNHPSSRSVGVGPSSGLRPRRRNLYAALLTSKTCLIAYSTYAKLHPHARR